MALVPLSVSMSRKISLVRKRKVLKPASVIAFRRWLTGGRLVCCTILTLCISMGKTFPFDNNMFMVIILSVLFVVNG